MGVVVLLCVFSFYSLLISCARIPTDVCDITSLPELVDIQTKANMERVACEAGQFLTYDCSRYWMAQSEVVRKQLSYHACSQRKRSVFRTWAGTRHVNGTFQSDFAATLQHINTHYHALTVFNAEQHDLTLTLTLNESLTTRQQLITNENAAATNERMNNFHEHSSVRENSHTQAETSQMFIVQSGNEERALVQQESLQIHTAVEEDGASSQSTMEHESEITSFFIQEQESSTYAYYHDSEVHNQVSLAALDFSEQAQTHNQVFSQSSTTRVIILSTTNITQNLVHQVTNDNTVTWSGVADSIMAALVGFQQGIPTSVFTTIGIHFSLANTAKTFKPSLDLYSRSDKFEQLRAIVDNTIKYNYRYGNTLYYRQAQEHWQTGEALRSPPHVDLKAAVIQYSLAYAYAAANY